MIQKKKPKQTLESRGIFVRKQETFDDVVEQSLRMTDESFYKMIWDERPHMCFESGVALPSTPLTLFFHHILPKAKYPEHRHAKWNIVLVSVDTHSQVETFIDKCPRVRALTEHLKLVYG